MPAIIPPILVLVICSQIFWGALKNEDDLYIGMRVEGLVRILGKKGTRILFFLIGGSGILFSAKGIYKLLVTSGKI